MKFDDATRAQIDAARPDTSTWLAANAGSGKTRVLTDRVARLLLSGVEPQHILCLTYTKAAASEMQNRLFKRLGAWSMLDDCTLRKQMAELGIEGDLAADALRDARTLFALAIESPGGLKIQTIHSFCASLLRRFPLEAEVSPQFTEIEDRAADLLRADIVDDMAAGPDAPLIEAIAAFYTGNDFASLTRTIVRMRETFGAEMDRDAALALFGQPAGMTAQDIEKQVFLGGEAEMIAGMIPHLLAKGANDGKAGEKLRQLGVYDIHALPVLEGIFLTGPKAKSPFSAKIGSFPTKPTQTVLSDVMPQLDGLMARVEATRDTRLCLNAAEKTWALHQFARRFLHRYETAKAQRGWLDFDDLILKARALLTDNALAAWVLYRIDGGIDHILVDEAQDTSPRQWDVIERLTDEFFSGQGVHPEVDRTLFVVGDKKQSIYSFQGADPLEFDRKAAMFRTKIEAADQPFQNRSLDYSFRSSSAILRLVDTAFDPRWQLGLDKETQHIAFKEALPGRVDLWPFIAKDEPETPPHWTEPLDRINATHHDVLLAEQIADKIAEMSRGEHYIPDDGPDGTTIRRRIRAGDFLILVQRRSTLFSEIIRACKARELPIAGADRLKVGAELAVKDLAALLSFLATPDDSLSLAAALKSPLFGWDEQALFDLAHRRTAKHLWEALRISETHPDTVEILQDLRRQVDFLRPYDLIERILTRHLGRGKLLSRLGPEAEDGINAMLSQALAYERGNVPSLTGFIEWMQTDDLEIKRQIDSASDQVRVMTVHGAKGLEAPIVILPDAGQREIRVMDEIIKQGETPVWKVASAEMPSAMQEAIDDIKDAQLKERLRLLYVAMTRAEKWLIIAAAGRLPEDGSAWYQIAEQAMAHMNAVPIDADGVKRFEEGSWDDLPIAQGGEIETDAAVLDAVFEKQAEIYCHEMLHLSPSDLGGAKALPGELGEDKETALTYGSLVHHILETMSGADPDEQSRLIAAKYASVPSELREAAQKEAYAVANDPHLAEVFSGHALTEVPISAHIANARFYGLIDKLLVTEHDVLAVDFKTNRIVPDKSEKCPEGILRQMGAYALMLAQVYPDHTIRTAVLWTAQRQLMALPHDLVTAAFRRSPHLDAGGRPT